MKLTAVHHQRPALVPEEQTAPARCLGSLYPAQKRLRKNGLSERRRVPRGESEGLMADRHRPWSKLASLSSRIQPKEAQTQSARPAGPSAHTQQGVQAFAAGRRSRRAAPADGALTSKLRSPSAPTCRATPIASPRELSNPTQSTTRASPDHNTQRRSSPSRRWRSASRPPRSSARRRRSTATCPRA